MTAAEQFVPIMGAEEDAQIEKMAETEAARESESSEQEEEEEEVVESQVSKPQQQRDNEEVGDRAVMCRI